VAGYWTATHWRYAELIALSVLFLGLFLTDVSRPLHQKQFGRYRQESVPYGWNFAGRFFGILAWVCGIYIIPFLNLHIPTLALNVGKLAWTISAVVPYVSLFSGEDTGGAIKALSHLSFDSMYFDAAALAPLRSPVIEQIKECLDHCDKGPSDPDTQKFIRNGERGTPWAGMDDLFTRVGNFLGVSATDITFHERTTNAIAFAFDEVIKNRKRQGLPIGRVLTTDIEYPGIINDLLPELERQRAIELLPPVQIKRLICNGASRDRIQEALTAAYKQTSPDIILVSHVFYGTGFVIDLVGLLQSFDHGVRPMVVVDGAQSLGNIEITSSMFQQIEYYCSGAHKWLMIPRHLGVLIRNAELLRVKHRYTEFELPNRPDSSSPQTNRPFSVTISYDPYFGLSGILRSEFQLIRMPNIAAHNRRLGDVFRNEILALGHRPVGDDSHSSIVSVSFGSSSVTEQIHRNLQLNGIKCKFLRIDDIDGEVIPVIRFCFHFYHSKDDVFRLLDVVESELLRLRS
jgi:selenocysteine lyase/cysteine desulfurase